jgi:hypothetical protein
MGVKPDVPYQITQRDLKENYVDYINAVNKEMSKLVK